MTALRSAPWAGAGELPAGAWAWLPVGPALGRCPGVPWGGRLPAFPRSRPVALRDGMTGWNVAESNRHAWWSTHAETVVRPPHPVKSPGGGILPDVHGI